MQKFIILVILLVSGVVYASKATGVVDSIIVRDSDGLTYFFLKDAVLEGTKPACATISYWVIKNESSSAGKSQLSMLLAAQASGRKVRVYGYGTCTRWSDGEDVNSIQTLNE